MTFDPFTRGTHPVGVRSDAWLDTERDRELAVEIWYPAAASHAGQDLDAATQDAFEPGWSVAGVESELLRQSAVRDAAAIGETTPLVLLIHGWAGYRREATFLGTHLASHGYTVVSPDVPGSTFGDVMAFLTAGTEGGSNDALAEHLSGIADGRQGDIPFLISTAAERLDVDTANVGVTGASFGGYSSIIAPAVDPRVAAVAPMCPAGGRAGSAAAQPVDDFWASKQRWDWQRPVPTLFLVADRDCMLPLHTQLDLLRLAPTPDKRMVVLADADHNHFVDDVEAGQAWLAEFLKGVAAEFPSMERTALNVVPVEELCPGAHAQLAWRGLITAHMDAHLRGRAEALSIVHGPIDAILADHGVTTSTIVGSMRDTAR
ncbi:dienelactone hydrolase family protein [Nocardia sp. CDC153]|uniref:alpha/beta hydrolase family protein n=1 Tax=Nocardia sp. CDC153 TaxID=3112167 RepID=UPI002DBD1EC6|nr:dienelactone hydrolase family protein [Nocardia sp. CDC153]MEC3952415.1 dienelactone hydrolase family protein [Nocardia sp. CDC153]